MVTEEKLTELQALAEAALERDKAATPGPWVVNKWTHSFERGPDYEYWDVDCPDNLENATFKSAARTSEPALAQAVLDLIGIVRRVIAAKPQWRPIAEYDGAMRPNGTLYIGSAPTANPFTGLRFGPVIRESLGMAHDGSFEGWPSDEPPTHFVITPPVPPFPDGEWP
jgi:hypothetical protein